MTKPKLAVLPLSESFHELWSDFGQEYDLDVVEIGRDDAVPANCVAVLIAAGGEERNAVDVLVDLAETGVPVFVVGASESHRFGVETLRRGGADYFSLPGDLDLLRRTIEGRSQKSAPAMDPGSNVQVGAFDALVGRSPALLETKERALRVSQHGDVSILILGETGTGKEVLSRAVHGAGPRATGPFIAVNCAAIPDNLLESELFGYEKGAFTGAATTKPGLFEEANGGTIFLDEIGQLPLTLQGKLLRVLEEKSVRRVGGVKDRSLDVKVVAATHVDLPGAVEKGEFREDLYYRLNVVSLTLPPLRERAADVELLAKNFLKGLADRYQVECPPLTDEVRRELRSYSWPGNVRELSHSIERALLLSPPGQLDCSELIHDMRPAENVEKNTGSTLADIMRQAAVEAVRVADGNKSAAARTLNVSRARLQRLLDGNGGAQ